MVYIVYTHTHYKQMYVSSLCLRKSMNDKVRSYSVCNSYNFRILVVLVNTSNRTKCCKIKLVK